METCSSSGASPVTSNVAARWALSEGSCARCALRWSGERSPERYLPNECQILHYLGMTALCNATSRKICVMCVGILQDRTLQLAVPAIHSSLSRIVHDGRVKLHATFPVSASVIRARLYAIRFKTKFPHAHSDAVSIREAFKLAASAQLRSLHAVRYAPDAQLFAHVSFTHEETANEASFAAAFSSAADSNSRNKRRRCAAAVAAKDECTVNAHIAVSATLLAKVVNAMNDTQFVNAVDRHIVSPQNITLYARFEVAVNAASILLAGKYTKLSRRISQTPWLCGVEAANGNALRTERCDEEEEEEEEEEEVQGHSRVDDSVEEVLVSAVRKVLVCERTSFTAGGREDVDVRMLGQGRPFVLELFNPGMTSSCVTEAMLEAIRTNIYARSSCVGIHALRIARSEYFSEMRKCEAEKRKAYRCIVWIQRPDVTFETLKEKLETPHGFLLYQKTPLRVLHRRTLAVRKRQVFQVKVVRAFAKNFFVMDLVTAAGTYIKEFVHGDNGRTRPNVGLLLGCNADILQLDVMDIHDGEMKTD